MSLQRFSIRAKNTLAGLSAFDEVNDCISPNRSSATHNGQPPCSHVQDCDIEDFGARLERCKGSPSKNSMSKRKKLFGSLRSIGSVANLRSSPTKAKQDRVQPTESPVEHAGSATAGPPMSPSLALLDFQQSPSDKPMFDLSLHERPTSGSSLEVHHSSPMAVPGSVRQLISYQLAPSAIHLPAGTLPDTPGPMQRAFNRDSANQLCKEDADPMPLERYAPSTPILTPLPGTNMSIDDVDPNFVPLPPSLNPSTVQLSRAKPGYFDIPINEQPYMNIADKLRGLTHLRLGGDNGDSISKDFKENGPSCSPVAWECAGLVGLPARTIVNSRDAKPLDTTETLHVQQQQVQALRRKQQAEAFDNAVRALECPQNRQALPIQPKQRETDLCSQNRNNSVTNGDWQTCSGGCSIYTTSERTHASSKQCKCTEHPTSITSTTPSEGSEVARSSSVSLVNFPYVVLDSPREHRLSTTQKSIWPVHAGLYDGSGYGIEDSGPATPSEPDKGTENVHVQHRPGLDEASPMSLLNGGGRPEEELSTRLATTKDPYLECVREWSPLPDEEQQDDAGLEFIYRAYA